MKTGAFELRVNWIQGLCSPHLGPVGEQRGALGRARLGDVVLDQGLELRLARVPTRCIVTISPFTLDANVPSEE
jgi:hypothetical protein